MGSATLDGLGYTRKQAEQTSIQHSYMVSAPVPASRFLPFFPLIRL